jgi:hypothetical protein
MLTREEQAELAKSLTGDLVINTHPDGVSGTNVTIPITVTWGFEPKKQDLPIIICKFIYTDQVYERTLTNYLGDYRGNGIEFGYLGQNGLLVKIKAVDVGDKDTGNVISAIDIVNALVERVQYEADIKWDKFISEGSVFKENGYSFSNVSSLLDQEYIEEMQGSIPINKIKSIKPIETGEVLFTNASTLSEINFLPIEVI